MKKKSHGKGGRPRKFTDVEMFQKKIDDYFARCDRKKEPYTVTGLALALGFTERKQLIDYEGRAEFADPVKKAKFRVQEFLEKRLHEPYPTGAIFALKNNFGWRDVQEIEHSGPGGEPLEMGNLELAARILSILELGRQRRQAAEEAKKALPEKVNDGKVGS